MIDSLSLGSGYLIVRSVGSTTEGCWEYHRGVGSNCEVTMVTVQRKGENDTLEITIRVPLVSGVREKGANKRRVVIDFFECAQEIYKGHTGNIY